MNSLLGRAARFLVKGGKCVKPIIGVTTDVDNAGNHLTNASYIDAILKAGGVPIILPTGIDRDVQQLCNMLDGLLLTGGGDVDPVHLGEDPHPKLGEVTPERDSVELLLARQFLNANKPILGICRGMQLLNIVFGGGIYQDMQAQYDKPLLQHIQQSKRWFTSHEVKVTRQTKFHAIVGMDVIRVNSFHHQAVKEIGRPLVVSAIANDGIVEVIESTAHAFVIGVQWHPEMLMMKGDAYSNRLFDAFVRACKK